MLLVDSSAWIAATVRPRLLLAAVGDERLGVCPPVIHEVLRGTGGGERYELTRSALLELELLDSPVPVERFEEAARLYIRCRDAGVTVSKNYDCLIAAIAIAHDATLLHVDSDFDHIARVTPLKARRIV